MKLWQYMQLMHTHRGYMDVAGKEEFGGSAGGADETASGKEGETETDEVTDKGKKENVPEDEFDGLSTAELIAKLKEQKKTSADLLKESMKRKSNEQALKDKLSKYGDIDPERARQLAEAESVAEKARMEAEQADLERRGEFESVKKQMLEAHSNALQAKDEHISALEQKIASLENGLVEKTVGSSFSESPFLREKVLMTPSKARLIYGSHFELHEDGQIVGYDKPAGAKERSVLVDGNGAPLKFEAAIERILRADPEADALLRSEAKQGAHSQSKPTNKVKNEAPKSTLDKLTSGLKYLK
ncbi:TPA: DUF6651 domain-containing protein [Raoultella ornithinolytica]